MSETRTSTKGIVNAICCLVRKVRKARIIIASSSIVLDVNKKFRVARKQNVSYINVRNLLLDFNFVTFVLFGYGHRGTINTIICLLLRKRNYTLRASAELDYIKNIVFLFTNGDFNYVSLHTTPSARCIFIFVHDYDDAVDLP